MSDLSKATFYGTFKTVEYEEMEKLGISKASLLSQASTLIPEGFDAEKNADVLPVIFNLAVVNKFNANNDGIDAKSAAKILKQFIHKPINIEHMKEYIVGHIINASFSDKQPDFVENDPMDFIDRETPFYITAAGLIYKHIYPELAQMLIDASNPESPYYKAYSTSWEISFTEYDLAIGSDLLSECKLYREGSEEFDIYNSNLKSEGGTGQSNKGQVNRLLGGEKYPLGCALTENPAADVKGIFTLESLLKQEKTESNKYTKKTVTAKKNSKNVKSVVTQDNELYNMDPEQFKELLEAVKGLSEKTKESKASSAIKEFESILKEHGTEWKSKAELAEEKAKTVESELTELKEKFANASSELETVKADLKVKEQADLFNARMNSIAEKFELDEAEEKIVSEDIRALDSEEAFASYLEKTKVIFKHKTKEAIAAVKEKEEESKASKAQPEKVEKKEDAELEVVDESKAKIPNNNGESSDQKTLVQRLAETGLELE